VKKEIITECCELFSVHPHDLLGQARFGCLMPARFALYKALAARGWSHAQTGRFLKRDRSTITHGVARAEYMMEQHPSYAAKVQRLIDFKPSYMQPQNTIVVAPAEGEDYDATPSRSET
jgi:chromosomal replication initiation ATPase DnaA